MQTQQQPISGPRSKCDQVVYEAIAKACEIVVRGRCDLPDPSNSALLGASSTAGGGAVIVGSDRPVHGIYSPQRGFHRQQGGGTGGAAASGSSGGRFNLEVAEVQAVR